MIPEDVKEYLRQVVKGEIPEFPPYHRQICYNEPGEFFFARDVCTRRNMWAMIAKTWTDALAEWVGDRRVLEVMAGAGWLAKALRECDIDMIATDNYSWLEWKPTIKDLGFLTDVEELNVVNAIKKYVDDVDVLLVSWPPQGHTFTRALDYWDRKKPIVFIGEEHGCTGDHLFWSFFDYDWNDVISIPQWYSMHDLCYIGYYETSAMFDPAIKKWRKKNKYGYDE